MELSQLHFHSWGLVANVKDLPDKEIKVVPIEYRFGVLESVLDQPEEDEETYQTDEGEEIVKVIHGTSVTAKWLKFNTNRITAPDVRRNDQVLIWRLGNTDRYFWTDMNVSNVKRLETVVYAWSADPNNPVKDDLSNAYFLEISTHNKSITLQTSQANEEPYGYTIQLNTADGVFQLVDTDENIIYLNSPETTIGFKNAMGTEFRLDKKNIHGYAPDSMFFKAEKTVKWECTDFILNASKSISFETRAWSVDSKDTISFTTTDWTAKATNISYDASDILFKAEKVTSNAPKTVATGLLTCAGLSVGGGGSGEGGLCVVNNFAEFKKGLVVNGGLKADTIECKSIKADSGNFKSHGPH